MKTNWDQFFHHNPEWRAFCSLIVIPPTYEEAVEAYPEIAGSGLEECGYQYAGSRPITRLALYMISRTKGNSHRFAVACAMQRFPGTRTEDVYWGGRKHFAEVYGDAYFNQTKQGLAKQGVNLTAHDEYFPELARFPADPQAVVTRSQGRSYIQQLCERRGWGCEGPANVKTREPERDELADEHCVPIAEDIVRSRARKMVKANPELKKKSRQELRSMVFEKHGRK
jgi:hypothetical protein